MSTPAQCEGATSAPQHDVTEPVGAAAPQESSRGSTGFGAAPLLGDGITAKDENDNGLRTALEKWRELVPKNRSEGILLDSEVCQVALESLVGKAHSHRLRQLLARWRGMSFPETGLQLHGRIPEEWLPEFEEFLRSFGDSVNEGAQSRLTSDYTTRNFLLSYS